MIAALACLGMVAVLDLGGGTSDKGVVMLTKAHNRHAKHRGNKYSDELSALAKRAGPDRRQALKNLEQLRLRSEGKEVHQKGGSKKGEPAALREMEQLAHRRAHTGRASTVGGLGALERSHGIKSSKDMLAEIMSLRHYKKNNQEIKNIANGFETHSSFSHRVQKSINKDEAQSRKQTDQANRRSEASALRLEAGRVSRDQMMHQAEVAAEKHLGAALTSTLKPIQAMLKRDEVTLDGMVSKKKTHEIENRIADAAAHRAEHVLMGDLDSDVKKNIKTQEIALEHKSHEYLTKVHAKAKAALTKVVNPDTVRPSQASLASPWSSKIQKFLDGTEKFMSKQAGSWMGISTGPVVSHKTEDTVIEATKKDLENQLRSEQATLKGDGGSPTPDATSSKSAGPEKKGPSAPVASVEKVAGAMGRLEAKKKGAGNGQMDNKTKKSWIKALNSYL